MALSRGMTALRAALGAVGGGLEGYTQFKELERKRQMEQEAMRRAEIGTLLSSGQVRLTPIRRTPDAAAAKVTALETPELPGPMTAAGQQSLMGRAIQAGMGVTAGAPSMAAPRLGTGAALPALDTTAARQVERGAAMQPAVPDNRITLAGQEFGLTPGLTDEEKINLEIKKYEAQQEVVDKRQQAARDRANRGFFSVLKRANYFGEGSKDLDYDEVKDIDLEPFFKEYTQTRQAEAALERAGIIARASAGRGGYIQGVDPATGQPQYYFAPSGGGVPQPTGVQAPAKEGSARSEMQTGLQGMGVARANSALNLLETNAKAMDKFEADLLANKSSINFVQLELARKALKGDAGSAAAEAALAKSGDSGRALLRYVRGGKAIAGAVREITPRGGSNLMMQMETALSGIGPAGADPESVNQVQVFRNDLLTGVREGVNAMRGGKLPTEPAAPAGPGGTYRPGMSFEAWKKAQGKGGR